MYCSPKSRGLAAWLWLFKKASRAKAAMKPSKWPGLFGPGLAWLTASGRALHSTSFDATCCGTRCKKDIASPEGME